jgi:hypothetical protein
MRCMAALSVASLVACASSNPPPSLAAAEASGTPEASAAPPRPTASVPAAPSADAGDPVRAVAVATRFPDLEKERSARPGAGAVDLDLVARAIDLAGPEMFVRFAAGDAPVLPFHDEQLTDRSTMNMLDEPTAPAGGLARFDVTTRFCAGAVAYPFPCVHVQARPLPDGAPGLVWSAREREILFVALDGESYAFDPVADRRASIRLGAGDVGAWPAAMPTKGFGRGAFPLRRKEAAPLELEDEAFQDCGARAAPIKKGAFAPDLAALRRGCKKEIAAWEGAFARSLDASAKTRTALYDHAKTRVASFAVAPVQGRGPR